MLLKQYQEGETFTDYLFRKNIFNDIIGIYTVTTSGCVLHAEYIYDAWGNCKVVDSKGNEITDTKHIGNINLFRYHGYYYDVETGLYFLSSRYYNPLWGRFISPDSLDYLDPESPNGFNLYAYCGNDPISNFYANNFSKLISRTNWMNRTVSLIENHISCLSDRAHYEPSKNYLSFSFGLITPGKYNIPSWMEINSLYVKGTLGWGYTFGEGYSIASFSTGVVDATFHTPKWFNSLPDNHLANPNIYLGFGTWNINASVGVGVSGTAEAISGTVGVQFGDAVSVEAKGYVGIGFTFDITNGIKFGIGLGLGYEISINIDWYELFH